jgi:hypothetical protein
MARKDFSGVRRRYRTSKASVGNALLNLSIEVPQSGVIRRLRTYNPDGTGTPNLTVQVWLVEPTAAVLAGHPSSEHDKILAPSAARPVEDTTATGYSLTKVSTDSNFALARMGVLWLRVTTADAATDHTLYFELEIETTA